jgi:hypothetical protein
MLNSPPFVASNSFVETPLRRKSFPTGLRGKARVFLTDVDIMDFMSGNKRGHKSHLSLFLKAEKS